MAEEVALIDSGATENFIDQETVKKLKLGSKKLSEPVRLRNINGTYNQSGSVTQVRLPNRHLGSPLGPTETKHCTHETGVLTAPRHTEPLIP